MKILDLGCGDTKLPGAIGVDFRKTSAVDIIHDLNKFPYPFKDNEFDYIRAKSILEHLDNLVDVFKELYRISKNGAKIEIIVPFFSCVDAFQDITHKHFFSYYSLDTFLSYNFPGFKFKIIKRKIQFGLRGKILFGIELFANLFPKTYERCFAYIIPTQTLLFILETVK